MLTLQIKCVFCRTQQHLLCHGFFDANDPNIPDTHVCYKCLLEPNEAPLLREMGTLVLLRRALRVIMEEGYPNRTRDFSQKLRKSDLGRLHSLTLMFCRLQRADGSPDHGPAEETTAAACDSRVEEQGIHGKGPPEV